MITMLLRVLGHQYARPVRRTLALMAAAAVAEGLSYLLLALVLRDLLGGAPDRVVTSLIAFGGAVAAFGGLRFWADRAGFHSGTTLLHGTYRRLGDHLARLPLGWYDATRVGAVSTLASNGVLQVMGVIAHLMGPLVSAVVTPLTVVAVLLVVNWPLGLAASLAIPLVVVIQRWTTRSMIAADAERVRQEQEAAGRVVEYLQAQPVLRAAGRSASRFSLLDRALQGRQRASRRSTWAALPGVLGLSLTVQALFTGLLALGTYLALGGSVGAPELLAILVLATRCADPLLSLSELGGQLHAARTELDRLDTVLRAEPLPEPEEPVEPSGGDLAFDRVTFRPGDRDVVRDVSFAVPEGGRLAVVGPSGAGKTTLLRLLARFADVDSGAVRVGGADVRTIDSAALMARIAIVFQDVYLFDATIEENIRLGRPDADVAAVRAAAAAAQLDEVIERLPGGWDAPVGEGGSRLSGGERQRVSIARALLKDAPIVLLDEVTSALDPVNEAAVQEGIERLMAGRTVIMVAHRLGTVRDADQVLFLADGSVVEQGRHDELVSRGGRYAAFWQAATAPAQ